MNYSLFIIDDPLKSHAMREALGRNVALLATEGELKTASLDKANGLEWCDSPDPWLEALRNHVPHMDELVIATDDTLTGELIGMHAASDVTDLISAADHDALPCPVRRMRYSAMTQAALKQSYEAAGTRLDANRLAAAMVREFARLMDQHGRQTQKTSTAYQASAEVRDAVDWLDKASSATETHEIRCQIQVQEQEKPVTGFVTNGTGALTEPARFSRSEARKRVRQLNTKSRLVPVTTRSAVQSPGLYPANSTGRILGLAVDELGFDIETAQTDLDALYLDPDGDNANS